TQHIWWLHSTVIQRWPLDQFHRIEVCAVLFAGGVDGDDVGVVQWFRRGLGRHRSAVGRRGGFAPPRVVMQTALHARNGLGVVLGGLLASTKRRKPMLTARRFAACLGAPRIPWPPGSNRSLKRLGPSPPVPSGPRLSRCAPECGLRAWYGAIAVLVLLALHD